MVMRDRLNAFSNTSCHRTIQTSNYMHKLTAVLVKISTLMVIIKLVALCENKIFILACAVVRLKAINPCNATECSTSMLIEITVSLAVAF